MSDESRRSNEPHPPELSADTMAERLRRAESLQRLQTRLLGLSAHAEALPQQLEQIVRGIEEESPAMMGSIVLLDGARVRHGAAPNLPAAFVNAIDGQQIGPYAGSCGTAMFRRERVVVEDIASDPLWIDYRAVALAHGLRASWSQPILSSEGEVLGSFAMYYREPRAPDAGDLERIESAARFTAIAILRRRAEAELDSERTLRMALDAAKMDTWIWDIPSGKLIWPKGGEERRGFRPGEFEGTRDALIRRMLPADRARVQQRMDDALAGRTPAYQVEYRLQLTGGELRWMEARGEIVARDAEGRPLRMAGVVTDISGRKAAERELVLAREWIDAAPDAFFRLAADGRIVDVNRVACTMSGYTREELLQLHLWDLSSDSEADFPRLFEALRKVKSRTREALAITKAGVALQVEISANHVEYEGEEYSCASVRDIAARKQLEEQLRQSQKMDAVGRLAGGVAHDFNNLLTVILSASELAARSDPAPELAQDLDAIREAARRAAELTRQLLAFARRQLVEPRALDLNLLATRMDKMLRRVIGEQIALVTRLSPELGTVRADVGQLEQVLLNLTVNARDAMPSGGQLVIETANASLAEPRAAWSSELPPGDYVVLSVSDTGCGMDRSTLGHIFEPFFTTKPAGKGTGLGLATCYGIVTQSGGALHVTSELGQGSCFRIYLPRISASERPAELLHAEPPRGAETLLLVEDDRMVRQLAARTLRSQGYTVFEAGNADEAIQLFEAHGTSIALLVTDVVMPGLNGKQLALALKLRRPDLKILYSSGYAEDAIVHHGVVDPGIDFLAKPYLPAVLLKRVREVLDKPPAA